MHKRVSIWILLFLTIFLTPGCGKEIGDSCSSSNDCPSGAVCDTSQPGGYCTITPCYKGDCPSESRCTDFGMDNTFCMKRCNDDYDCRDGYRCVKDIKVCMYVKKSEQGNKP